MKEYLLLSLFAKSAETQASFNARLIAFWTHMLRNFPDDYEQVYSEETAFDHDDSGRILRRYMIEPQVWPQLQLQLEAQGIDREPLDEDELYSRAEASASPDWFQIEH